jgi:uncharacterized protein
MKIGIISDTHNNFEITKQACRLFKNRKIDILIHAGDFTSPEILALFKDFNCRFVMGNADRDIEQLNAECLKIGFDYLRESCELTVDDKKILILHGNVVPVFRDAVASGKYNYIIKGHTHHFEDYIRNNTRVINPGGLEQECSIAILDTENDELERIILKTDL